MCEADREALKQGYSLFPPFMHLIENLTKRVISLTYNLRFNWDVVEVYPASTRKTLSTPTKDWQKAQAFLKQLGMKRYLEMRIMMSHKLTP